MHVRVAPVAVTHALADFAMGLRYEDLPADIVKLAKQCILDNLGCGIYGSAMPWNPFGRPHRRAFRPGADRERVGHDDAHRPARRRPHQRHRRARLRA